MQFRVLSLLKLALLALTLTVASAAQAAPKAAAAKTDFTWWGHAAWVIKTPAGTTIAIDPWLRNPKAPAGMAWPEKVDVILVTHGHGDHVGDTIELAKKTGAQVVGCYELTSLLGVDKAIGGNVGGTVEINDVKIHFVEAVHSSGYSPDGKSAPQYGGAPVGYVVEIKDGPTFYHAGDTNYFADMELIGSRLHPSIALLPIGGHYTMGPEGAAFAAKLLKVKTVIPMHFGTFPVLTGTPEALRTALKKESPKSTVLEFKPGETKSL
jgi:L-ascorbate metabolism protein UlaG (beta-lactamase superfamily)